MVNIKQFEASSSVKYLLSSKIPSEDKRSVLAMSKA